VLVSAAVCPHPPLMVPELAAGAATELDALRAACNDAVQRIVDSRPDLVVGVGPDVEGSGVREFPADAYGSFAAYGVDIGVGTPYPGQQPLPLSLAVGAWLLRRCAWDGQPLFVALGTDVDPDTCLGMGKQLAQRADRVALLVLGDGSARRSEKAPGYVDARAVPYDSEIRRALELGDVCALAQLDPELSAELLVGGRTAWQVLAGAAEGVDVNATLLAQESPYGVAYFVASWVVS
jgi:hypothetical protein